MKKDKSKKTNEKKLKKSDFINKDGTLTNKGTVAIAVSTLSGVWAYTTCRDLFGKLKNNK